MKIGVGVITLGQRVLPPAFYTPQMLDPETEVHIEYDDARTGVGPSRNRVLRRLYDAGAEHIFLFDDDCYPVMRGWERYFIEGGYPFLGLPEVFKSRLVSAGHDGSELCLWDSIIGCFNYQTRSFLDAIGGYDAGYSGYGYEDVGRNARALRSLRLKAFPSLLRAPAYIHSMDVFGEHPEPSLSDEEKAVHIERNHPVLLAENASHDLYRPF